MIYTRTCTFLQAVDQEKRDIRGAPVLINRMGPQEGAVVRLTPPDPAGIFSEGGEVI